MKNNHVLGFCLVLPLLFVSGCQTTAPTTTTTAKLTDQHSEKVFQEVVRPVLEHRCIHCHNNQKPLAGLNFQSRHTVFEPSPKGAFIVAGNPQESRIWKALSHPKTHPGAMPGDGWGLTVEKKAAFKAWIESGAFWPKGKPGQLDLKPYQVDIDGYL